MHTGDQRSSSKHYETLNEPPQTLSPPLPCCFCRSLHVVVILGQGKDCITPSSSLFQPLPLQFPLTSLQQKKQQPTKALPLSHPPTPPPPTYVQLSLTLFSCCRRFPDAADGCPSVGSCDQLHQLGTDRSVHAKGDTAWGNVNIDIVHGNVRKHTNKSKYSRGT